MKRPAKDVHAAHREQDQGKDHQEANRHGQQERLTNDVGCEHPTNMQKASGSNKYYARMVCHACGLLLYNVDRRLDPQPCPDGWEDIWENLTYGERIEIRRVQVKNRRRND